jgi:hypothetical protein
MLNKAENKFKPANAKLIKISGMPNKLDTIKILKKNCSIKKTKRAEKII